MRGIVFTPKAIDRIASTTLNESWFEDFSIETLRGLGVLQATEDGVGYYSTPGFPPTSASTLLIVDLTNAENFRKQSLAAKQVIVQRLSQIVARTHAKNYKIPSEWTPFHHNNLVQFFATNKGAGTLRVILQRSPKDTPWLLVSGFTSESDAVDLSAYTPSLAIVSSVEENLGRAADQLLSAERSSPAPRLSSISREIDLPRDLEASSSGAITRYWSYEEWLKHLNPAQREFMSLGTDLAIKLRGPAGTGKTLCLQLKVIDELKRNAPVGSMRVLFATHSWSLASQICDSLEILAPEYAPYVDCFPLLEVASLHAGRNQDRSPPVLGTDSHEGKQFLFKAIASRILAFRTTADWRRIRDKCSDMLVERMESPPDSAESASLVWDLMQEFTSVIAANGIMPGINAEGSYLQLERRPWMLPLTTATDKRTVLYLYSQHVRDIAREGKITSDQLILDALKSLGTFEWNIRRSTDGYDLIAVDEFHLFTEQERALLYYLTKDPEQYPRMLIAQDPSQNPWKIYTEQALQPATSVESSTDRGLGKYRTHDLREIHRFTRQIQSVLQCLVNRFPVFDIDSDSISLQESVAHASDEVPEVVFYDSDEALEKKLAGQVRSISRSRRSAVICLDESVFSKFATTLENDSVYRVVWGRDEVDAIKYTSRTTVVSVPAYLAGLQFEDVHITCFWPEWRSGSTIDPHRLRSFLSSFYLAASRAEKRLYLHALRSPKVPAIVEELLSRGVVVEASST